MTFIQTGPPNQAATVIVAAANSLHPGGADYVCSGTDDQVQIQAAIDAMQDSGGGEGGGTVQLLEGVFVISDKIRLSASVGSMGPVVLKGAGKGFSRYCTRIMLADNVSAIGEMVKPGETFCDVKDLVLDGNRISQVNTVAGIGTAYSLPDILMSNLAILRTSGSGIKLKVDKHCLIENCWVEYCDYGIEASDAGDSGAELKIISTHITSSEKAGIYIQGQTSRISTMITGCSVENNFHGLHLKGAKGVYASNSIFTSNSRGVTNNFDGIYIEDNGATPTTDVVISNCDCNSLVAPGKQRYGINITGGSDYITIKNNLLRSNTTSGLNNTSSGTHNIIKSNQGYITENSGTSTGTGAQQLLPHSLADTPTKVILWNIENGANPYQSAAADGTHIKITAIVNQDYGWQAEV